MKKKVGNFDIEVKLFHERVLESRLPLHKTPARKGRPSAEWMGDCLNHFYTYFPKGGRTFCAATIKGEGFILLFNGEALCSMSDSYNKETGELLALRRCYANVEDFYEVNFDLDEAVSALLELLDGRMADIESRQYNREIKRYQRNVAAAQIEIARLAVRYDKLAKTKPAAAGRIKERVKKLQEAFNLPQG